MPDRRISTKLVPRKEDLVKPTFGRNQQKREKLRKKEFLKRDTEKPICLIIAILNGMTKKWLI